MLHNGYVDWDSVPVETIMDGIHRRLVTTDKMTIVRWDWDAGMNLPLHAHPEDQYYVLLSGAAEFESDGVVRQMKPGDTWMVPGGVPHATRYPVPSVTMDIFAPPRYDMIKGVDPYIRAATKDGSPKAAAAE